MTDIVERLRTMAAECGVIDCNEAADEIERLRTDVEVYVKAASELELDAARYRWLRDECSWTMVSGNGKSNLSICVRAEFDLGELVNMVDEFDAAIDAAMKL